MCPAPVLQRAAGAVQRGQGVRRSNGRRHGGGAVLPRPWHAAGGRARVPRSLPVLPAQRRPGDRLYWLYWLYCIDSIVLFMGQIGREARLYSVDSIDCIVLYCIGCIDCIAGVLGHLLLGSVGLGLPTRVPELRGRPPLPDRRLPRRHRRHGPAVPPRTGGWAAARRHGVYVKFRQYVLCFGHFELDVRGHASAQGAACSCLRLDLADAVLI